MKLLFLTTGYLPMPAYKGGAVETLLQQYVYSNKSDFIVIYSIGNKKTDIEKTEGNIEYRYIYSNIIFKIITVFIGLLNILPFINIPRFYIYNIIKDLKKRGELNYFDDIILENTPKSIPYLKKKIKSILILHLHNDYLNVKTKFGKDIINNCEKIICVSKFIKMRVDEICSNNKTVVVYNGLNFEKFQNNNNKTSLRKKHGIDPDSKVILYVGRLLEKKGIFELINAFKNTKMNNSILLIVGNGKKKIIKKIKKELNDNIILYNYIDNSKIYEIYCLADIGVVPSKTNEAFGLTAIEGLACNLKMILSNDGALPEISKNQNVIIVNKNNLQHELEESLNELLLSNKFEDNNIIDLKKKFDIKVHVKNIDKEIKN